MRKLFQGYKSVRASILTVLLFSMANIMWIEFAIAKDLKEKQTIEHNNYPGTPEGVVEDFIKNNHSVKAMKQYYLNCEGIDCEGEVTNKERFMMVQFDFDLDVCNTEGLRSINSRIMTGHNISEINKIDDEAKVVVVYKVKGIFNFACVPRPNIHFIPYENWKMTVSYDLVRQNNIWKIKEWFIEDQPPFPKSQNWAIDKINDIVQFNKDNFDFVDKAKKCIVDIKDNKECLIQ